MRSENHELENYRDQLKQLEKEYELADKNLQMFYRLWQKWTKEKSNIRVAKIRIKRQIDHIKKTTP